jgi:hypothetical protein
MSVDVKERLRRLEEAVGRLRGVRGARADLDPSGSPSVRALVLPESDHSAIAGAIDSLAKSSGVALEPESIEILRADLPAPGRRSRRRRLASLSVTRSDDGFTVRVTLELNGDVLLGETEGPSGRRFEMRAIAGAVLDGLGDVIGFEAQLETVNLLQAGETRLAVVQLNTHTGSLVGSALVRYDEHDAVARATLAAVNRVIAEREPLDAEAASPATASSAL